MVGSLADPTDEYYKVAYKHLGWQRTNFGLYLTTKKLLLRFAAHP